MDDSFDVGEDEHSNGSSHLTSSLHGSTGNSSGDRSKEDSSESLQKLIAEAESRNVFRLRLLVILVLIVVAALISFNVHSLTSKAETDEFESQYEGAAEKIIDSFEDILGKMGSVTGLGMALTSYGVDHEAEWPFVTLNNFQQKAKHARQQSGALMLGINPLVSKNNFAAWDDYINQPENQKWM